MGNIPQVAIVAGAMRTGSTAFCHVATQFEDVQSLYEVINPGEIDREGRVPFDDLVEYVHGRTDVLTSNHCLAKVFHEHLAPGGWRAFAEAAASWPMMVLYRRDVFGQFVSLRHAETTGQWKSRVNSRHTEVQPLRLEVEDFLSFRDKTVRNVEAACDALESLNGFHVVAYEDFAADPVRVVQRSLWHLFHDDFDEGDHSSQMMKQIDQPLDEVVRNFADFEAVLRDGLGSFTERRDLRQSAS